MPWKVHFIGTPLAIKRALRAQGNNLSGVDRDEFNRARPALEALMELTDDDVSVSLSASYCAGATPAVLSVVLMQSNAMYVQ